MGKASQDKKLVDMLRRHGQAHVPSTRFETCLALHAEAGHQTATRRRASSPCTSDGLEELAELPTSALMVRSILIVGLLVELSHWLEAYLT